MDNSLQGLSHQGATSSKQHVAHPGCPDSLSCLADSDSKPRDTFATIIRCAILSTPTKRMTLNCIYTAIEEKYPYYRDAGPGWKNTVRHVLSTSQQFEKSRRPITEPGKGGYWSVNKSMSKTDNPRNRRTNRTVARKESSLPEPPSTVWAPSQSQPVQDFPYMRSLPTVTNDQAPEGEPRFGAHLGQNAQVAPMQHYQDHQPYQVVPQMSQIPQIPQFPQHNSLLYSYDKPPERPGWLTEVSWGNAPLGNVAANGRQ